MAEVRREWLEKDYYKDLDLTQVATDEEISAAYKKLVRKLHPDRNPGNKRAEEKFKTVTSAYEVIGDPSTRKQYDQVRQTGIFGGQNSSGRSGQYSSQGNYQHVDFDASDLLSNLFGGRSATLSGQDYETNIRITFDESMKGVVKKVTGYGGKSVSAKIPAGINNLGIIKIVGKGGSGSGGGPPGDLYVKVSVEEHEIYKRKGNNLILNLPVSFTDLTLGATIEIPTYQGDVIKIRIPAGTDSGTKFKIKGSGVPIGKNKKGDLLVQVEVKIPKKLNTKVKDVVKKLGKLFE